MHWEKIVYLWFVSNIVSLPYGLLVARAFFIFLDKIISAVAISGCTHKKWPCALWNQYKNNLLLVEI